MYFFKKNDLSEDYISYFEVSLNDNIIDVTYVENRFDIYQCIIDNIDSFPKFIHSIEQIYEMIYDAIHKKSDDIMYRYEIIDDVVKLEFKFRSKYFPDILNLELKHVS